MSLNQLTITDSLTGLKERKFSALELVKSCLEKIKKTDFKIKAFVTLAEEEAIAQAKKIDGQKDRNEDNRSLRGIPFAIKDNFLTAGLKTTASSNVLKNYLPVYDATVVKRLKEAGAIIIGKTNMDAWAHGSSTETSDFFTTKNPWDISRLPGGSSGGSAAAIAADMTIGAIGSETAGSIRQPACWCGVIGLKPTYGRVSRYGVIAMASSTDSPGPISKSVEDAAVIFNAIAGKDENDSTSSFKPVENLKHNLLGGIKGIKIGIPKEYLVGLQREIFENTQKAISVLKSLRAEIIEISLLDPKYSVAVYTILQRSEVSSNLARYDGVRYGNDRTNFGDEAIRRIMLGTYTLSSGYYDQYYLKAQKARRMIINDFNEAFQKVDLIVGPTSPCTALPIGSSKDEAMFGELQDILVEASSISGLPGINVCSGFSKENLPTGIQIVGPHFSEKLILQTALAYEEFTNWHTKKPLI